MIPLLASRADKVNQAPGIADFVHRFCRRA
jgi:hypothetical protein